jgi:hypothetical protein
MIGSERAVRSVLMSTIDLLQEKKKYFFGTPFSSIIVVLFPHTVALVVLKVLFVVPAHIF